MIIKRSVPKTKQGRILDKCHASPYGGHFARERIAHKILQSYFIGLLYSKTVLNG